MNANYEKLNGLINSGSHLIALLQSPDFSQPHEMFQQWRMECRIGLSAIFGPASVYLEQFVASTGNQDPWQAASAGLGVLRGIFLSAKRGEISLTEHTESPGVVRQIEQLCDNFHSAAMQLRSRHRGRDPFWIHDEYDVQYLLHALLKIQFVDIRPEEWTPSYAGKSARMDFLLKQEQTVIETKMSSEGLTGGEIGSQLLIDIARYKEHSDCKRLVCFVYDPEHKVANPRGLEFDLNKSTTDDLAVVAFIRPL